MNKIFCLCVIAFLSGVHAFAAVEPRYQDFKMPTQQMVEKQTITNPAAAGSADVLSAHAGNTAAGAVTVSTFVAQPDVPRNLVVTPGGTTGDIAAACKVIISGTDILGQSISEQYQFTADQSSAMIGALAFRTVSSILFSAGCEEGGFAATWSVGYGEKLGIKRCLNAVGHIFFSTLNGAKEATAPTVVINAGSSVAGMTADYVGTMNGSNDFELFFMQNFRCKP